MDPIEALAPLEAALLDHHDGRPGGPLRLRFDDGGVEEVDGGWFFRPEAELGPLDRAALSRCRGRVLDVGAGAGVHALPLLARGHDVTALEILPGAVRVLRERGVSGARLESVWEHRPDRPYDTVLILLNGTGLAGTLPRLTPLLARVRDLLAPGGRALIDSTRPEFDDPGARESDDPGARESDHPGARESDHSGARDSDDPGPPASGEPPGGPDLPDRSERWPAGYPGEAQIQLEYGGRRGPPFPHLYVGPETLAEHAAAAGLLASLVPLPGPPDVEEGRFLAELSPSVPSRRFAVSTEGADAPPWQGTTTSNSSAIARRSDAVHGGCSGGRMQANF